MIDHKAFFSGIRQAPFSGKFSVGQVLGTLVILDELKRRPERPALAGLILALRSARQTIPMQPRAGVGDSIPRPRLLIRRTGRAIEGAADRSKRLAERPPASDCAAGVLEPDEESRGMSTGHKRVH